MCEYAKSLGHLHAQGNPDFAFVTVCSEYLFYNLYKVKISWLWLQWSRQLLVTKAKTLLLFYSFFKLRCPSQGKQQCAKTSKFIGFYVTYVSFLFRQFHVKTTR